MPEEDATRLIKNMELRGIWSAVFKQETSVIANDPVSHPNYVGTPEGHPPLTSFLGVPMKESGETIGMIGLANKKSGYDPDDQEVVEALSVAFVEALQRKRAEDALRAHRDHLEELVAARTTDLSKANENLQEEIAEHTRTEEVLARERNLLQTLIDNLPDYIYAKDSNSRFILNNRAHVRVLGAETPDEVVGKTDYDFFPHELAEQYYSNDQTVIRTGQPMVNREEMAIDEGGRKQWLLSTKVPLQDDSGTTVGIVGMSRDITERKRMGEALERHAGLLEQANADLEAQNRELDEFTYIASHDLQEPLRKLSAYSDLLQEDMKKGDQEEADRDLGVLASAARRMQKLVQDLLALSRYGRRSMKLEEVALDEIVDLALDALALRIEESGAELVRSDLPVIRGDRSLLAQLYQNLVGNSLKFCGNKPPRIELTAEKVGGYWTLGVADNGIGLDPKYAEQVFSPFKRLHGRDDYEGTGIGLAVCRKIVERHGGRIWVESELGNGAHFRFILGEPKEEVSE
jgi:PAS domain S-box-containing protein